MRSKYATSVLYTPPTSPNPPPLSPLASTPPLLHHQCRWLHNPEMNVLGHGLEEPPGVLVDGHRQVVELAQLPGDRVTELLHPDVAASHRLGLEQYVITYRRLYKAY